MNSLSTLRKNAKLSQKDVAEAMGVGQTRISAIERTKLASIQVETLAAYAQAVGAELNITVKHGKEKTTLLPAPTEPDETTEA